MITNKHSWSLRSCSNRSPDNPIEAPVRPNPPSDLQLDPAGVRAPILAEPPCAAPPFARSHASSRNNPRFRAITLQRIASQPTLLHKLTAKILHFAHQRNCAYRADRFASGFALRQRNDQAHARSNKSFGLCFCFCYVATPFSPESFGGERQRPLSVPAPSGAGGHNNT